MPKFSYKAKEGPGKLVTGMVEAENMDIAVKKVLDLGFSPIDIQPQKISDGPKEEAAHKPVFTFRKSVRPSIIVLFTRQLSDLVDAAIPILRALQLAERQTRHAYFKTVLGQMHSFVRDGGSLSGALSQHPSIFPPLYINMVRAGEVSGQLGLVLNRLAGLLEKDQETQLRIRSSLAYPIFVLAVGVLSVFVLLTFVIPRLTVIFEDFNQQLPLPTVILMRTSDFFARFWWLIGVIAAVAFVYFRRWSLTEKAKIWIATKQLNTPILGDFILEVEVGRFSRTMGTLVESGVVIIDALHSVLPLLENEVLRQEMKEAIDEVTHGSSLAAALRKSPFFPEAAVNMIAVGEETGRLEKGLFKLADSLERQADATAKTMVSLVGPAFLVIVVGLIGAAVISMLLPIFKMNLIVQ